MKKQLHIFGSENAGLRERLRKQNKSAEYFDLCVSEPDYERLLEMIFEAERIAFWGSVEV